MQLDPIFKSGPKILKFENLLPKPIFTPKNFIIFLLIVKTKIGNAFKKELNNTTPCPLFYIMKSHYKATNHVCVGAKSLSLCVVYNLLLHI
jgi:hypothetical protein